MPILSYENEISFTSEVNSFLYEWLGTRPRFDKEAITELGYRKCMIHHVLPVAQLLQMLDATEYSPAKTGDNPSDIPQFSKLRVLRKNI